jgi:hypothetical protein
VECDEEALLELGLEWIEWVLWGLHGPGAQPRR